MFNNPYTYGWLTLIVFYILSITVTGSFLPWALARGHNKKISTSKFQFFIFTSVIIFAYTSVIAWRVINAETGSKLALPEIPINLLLLIGFSVATSAGSKGITISYLTQNQLSDQDNSDLTKNREGSTDLIKVQMLIWTFISAVVYLITFYRFMSGDGDPAIGGNNALPDIDSTLLVLMGISQGGYLGSKLVGRTGGMPIIEKLIPDIAKIGTSVTSLGIGFGPSKEGNDIIFMDPSGKEDFVTSAEISEWSDTKIIFTIPDKFDPPGELTAVLYKVKVRAKGLSSKEKQLEVGK